MISIHLLPCQQHLIIKQKTYFELVIVFNTQPIIIFTQQQDHCLWTAAPPTPPPNNIRIQNKLMPLTVPGGPARAGRSSPRWWWCHCPPGEAGGGGPGRWMPGWWWTWCGSSSAPASSGSAGPWMPHSCPPSSMQWRCRSSLWKG